MRQIPVDVTQGGEQAFLFDPITKSLQAFQAVSSQPGPSASKIVGFLDPGPKQPAADEV
jgi:hypothetical protein